MAKMLDMEQVQADIADLGECMVGAVQKNGSHMITVKVMDLWHSRGSLHFLSVVSGVLYAAGLELAEAARTLDDKALAAKGPQRGAGAATAPAVDHAAYDHE